MACRAVVTGRSCRVTGCARLALERGEFVLIGNGLSKSGQRYLSLGRHFLGIKTVAMRTVGQLADVEVWAVCEFGEVAPIPD